MSGCSKAVANTCEIELDQKFPGADEWRPYIEYVKKEFVGIVRNVLAESA